MKVKVPQGACVVRCEEALMRGSHRFLNSIVARAQRYVISALKTINENTLILDKSFQEHIYALHFSITKDFHLFIQKNPKTKSHCTP